MKRYQRQIILDEIGPAGQDSLAQARVLMIGAGGLGCPALQYLAAAGVGTIGIMDHDVVEESNLHRQTLYGQSSLGQNKALAAKDRLIDLNPDINIIAIPEKLDKENALEIFREYDMIIEGSDSLETRYLASDASLITGIPMVYGAIFRYEGQVSVFNLPEGPSYRCLFPKKPNGTTVPNCEETGVIGVLPGMIGTMMASEALKYLLNIGELLHGKLWCFNLLDNVISQFGITRNDQQIRSILDEGLQAGDYLPPGCSNQQISISELANLGEYVLVDVREEPEISPVYPNETRYLPLSGLDTSPYPATADRPAVFFCEKGKRSLKVAEHFTRLGHQCYSLKEGATELFNHLQLTIYEH